MSGLQTPVTISPHDDEIEISIFGPGFGESLVAHLGNGEWIIVDSCRDLGASGANLPIRYLESLGVNLETSVKLIVLTHWHDDHIRGIGEILTRCESAKVAMTSALSNENFRNALSPWLAQNTAIKETTGLAELRELGPRLRQLRPIYASHNKILFDGRQPFRREVRALSPSDASVMASIVELANVPKDQRFGRIPKIHGNHTSVVLSIEVEKRRILLGADLETRPTADHGWLAVIEHHKAAELPAYEVWKASHHGSSNGDDPRIWGEMLTSDPHVLLAPFVNGGVKLPQHDDVARILKNTKNAWITARPESGKFRMSNRLVEKQMTAMARNIQIIPRSFGHVRLRSKISGPVGDWDVITSGDASPLGEL